MSAGRDLVQRAAVVLLDFDGPVCSVFARLPATLVAERLRQHLENWAPTCSVPPDEGDPLEVLRWVSAYAPGLAKEAEALLAAWELKAAATATQTDGCAEFLRAMAKDGRPVAIVSNNSERAIDVFLKAHKLKSLIAFISGRDPSNASWMKPHPRSLLRALDRIGSRPSAGVMIGDSVTDVEAAKRISTPVIGLANKTGKATRLRQAGADAVIASMSSLLA